jgi:hypothetical protein
MYKYTYLCIDTVYSKFFTLNNSIGVKFYRNCYSAGSEYHVTTLKQ